MLFSIYLASLIALSTGVEFKRSQPPLVKCRLFVYVDASPKGWIRLGPEDTLTAIGTKGPGSQTEFHDAQEFLWGGNDSDEESSTLKTYTKDGLMEIVMDSAKIALTLRKPHADAFIAAVWTPLYYQIPTLKQPTELALSGIGDNKIIQYCTPNQFNSDKNSEILRATSGPINYDCKDAAVFVRFIYGATVNTFPQNAKIGLYTEDRLLLLGWLLQSGGRLSYGGFEFHYDDAPEFMLNGDSTGKFTIHSGTSFLRKTTSSDNRDAEALDSLDFYTDGSAEMFNWANGNPNQIGSAAGSPILYYCTNNKTNSGPYVRIDPFDSSMTEWTCDQVMWIISVTG